MECLLVVIAALTIIIAAARIYLWVTDDSGPLW